MYAAWLVFHLYTFYINMFKIGYWSKSCITMTTVFFSIFQYNHNYDTWFAYMYKHLQEEIPDKNYTLKHSGKFFYISFTKT